jgi:hypothetical protein
MATKSYAKKLEELLIEEFETSNMNMNIKGWVSLVLEILSKMLKWYWIG